jgi:predicted outer membrane repeat protein
MVNCTFTDNAVTVISPDGGTLPGSGGAVNLTGSTMTRFKECIFTGNKATGTPNGVWEGGGGGAVYMSSFEGVTNKFGPADIAFENCGFYNNTASDNTGAWGGATQHKSDTGKLKASYVNCVFHGNYAQTDGGAVGNYYRVLAAPAFVPGLETNFTNCTFSNNSAGDKGGALYYNKATGEPMALSSRIENSILFGNSAPVGPHIGFLGFSGPVLAFNLLEGGYNATLGVNGGNNLAGDPMFINAADPDGADNVPGTSDDGLRVNSGSPAVNSGNNSAAGLMGITTDFAGAARVQGGSVDMGAYESATIYIPPVPIKYYWLREWRKPKPGCLSCPWAIRIVDKSIIYNPNKPNFGLIQNFIWKSKPQLIVYADSAIVTGRIASQQSPSIQFDVYLKLIEQNDWQGWAANNRTYSAHTPEAKQVADQHFQNWTYWVLSKESRLVGRASISGTLKLEHSPENKSTGFQLGLGANDQDGDFGLNGEFTYHGVLSYKKLKLQVKGTASLNADAELCETDCSLENENNSIARVDFSNNSSLDGQDKDFQILRIYPNPVHDKLTVELFRGIQGAYRWQLFDMRGQLVDQADKQVNQGNFVIDMRHLANGIYRLEIISPEGKIQYEKIIHY